jgi:hypothetical protein
MRPCRTIRNWTSPSLMTIVLALSMTATTFAGGPGGGGPGGGGPGGGGGGGGSAPANPFVGSWAGGAYTNSPFRYDFTFTKDFKFTLVETEYATGLRTASFSGTYVLGGFGPNGFPVITMFSQGQILLKEEYSAAFEGIALRGTIFLVIARL